VLECNIQTRRLNDYSDLLFVHHRRSMSAIICRTAPTRSADHHGRYSYCCNSSPILLRGTESNASSYVPNPRRQFRRRRTGVGIIFFCEKRKALNGSVHGSLCMVSVIFGVKSDDFYRSFKFLMREEVDRTPIQDGNFCCVLPVACVGI
jgi:hypothetical protein